MARIVVGGYMVRYPLGGMNLGTLGWLIGLQRLGHDVYLVEKNSWSNACYDPSKGVMTDDCSYGIGVVTKLMERFGLHERWCFVDAAGRYHGLARERVEPVLKSADLFLGFLWDELLVETADVGTRVFIDGEPGYFQMRLEKRISAGEQLPHYDHYITPGTNVGTGLSSAPTADRRWRPFFDPVVVDLLPREPASVDAPFTTVMNWKSHERLEFNGRTYGQKDVEFLKFLDLPGLTAAPLEAAISGDAPVERLLSSGWRVRDADEVAVTVDSYWNYILASRGEFSVAKNVFVETNCGWFCDRSGYYLASGRPVVVQDTGFSHHLPCGRGLFAVKTVEEAAEAINEVSGDYERHSKWAREMAIEYLDATKVLGKLLRELGV